MRETYDSEFCNVRYIEQDKAVLLTRKSFAAFMRIGSLRCLRPGFFGGMPAAI